MKELTHNKKGLYIGDGRCERKNVYAVNIVTANKESEAASERNLKE